MSIISGRAGAGGGEDFCGDFVVGTVAGVDRAIGCLGIKWLPDFQQSLDQGTRVGGAQERALLVARDAFEDRCFGRGEPDDEAEGAEQGAVLGGEDSAAAGGDDGAGAPGQRTKHGRFPEAKGGFAFIREEGGDAAASIGDDQLVGVDKLEPELSGEPAADGRFAGAHEADEDEIVGLSAMRRMRRNHGAGKRPEVPLLCAACHHGTARWWWSRRCSDRGIRPLHPKERPVPSGESMEPPVPHSAVAAVVAVVMGSKSDWPTLEPAVQRLRALEIPCEHRVVSAHRTPALLASFAREAAGRGVKIIIAGAGGAAHLPGMLAAQTELPVLGVPVESRALKGIDSLLSIVQMPRGIPVGTLAIGPAGAENAALLAAAILALSDDALRERLREFRARQTAEALASELPEAS